MSIEDPSKPTGGAYGTTPGTYGTSTPDLTKQASDDLGAVTEKAKHDLEAVGQRAAEDVRELRHQAGEKMGEATEKAKSFASDQKDLAAGQISGVAAAITKVADELDGSDQQTVARYARDLANSLSSMGKTIESRDVDDLMGLAQDFGRKQPVAFLGAAALAGFVASRFALASTHRRETKPASTGYAADQATGYQPGTSAFSGTAGYSGATGQNRTGGQ